MYHQNHIPNTATSLLTICGFLIAIVFFSGITNPVRSQTIHENPYEISWRPSLWFNSADGVQLGARVFGYRDNVEMGSYRMKAGFWVNTFLPDVPVAYEFAFETPVVSYSPSREELALSVSSRLREGLHHHTIGISKRFERGTHDDQFARLFVRGNLYEQFDDNYMLFNGNWQQGIHFLPEMGFYLRNGMDPGRYVTMEATAKLFTGASDHTIDANITWYEPLNRFVNLGLAVGLTQHTSNDTRPEHASNLAFPTAFEQSFNPWLRSRGTVPPSFVRNGHFVSHRSANLRGYALHDVNRFESGQFANISGIRTISAELDFWNPISNYIQRNELASRFLHFKTYAFADAAHVSYRTNSTTESVIGNAGLGLYFRFNLPDYLAEARGFTIRWDVPFWVSDPLMDEKLLKFRHQLSFDIIIPF
jgi:hypothetical protein